MWIALLLSGGDAAAQDPRRFDVLIHEIFADPSPAVGLPGSEFVELRNATTSAINLRNWKISDGSSVATIGLNYILLPDSVVIVCPSTAATSFGAFGPVIGVTGFPSLNNDGDVISLLSPSGAIIHAVAYALDWYHNAVKSDGGWSLEMVDANNPCGGENNWSACRDAKGGTPGAYNSIVADNPDTQPPALLRTYTVDSLTIAAVFDEPLDSSAAADIMHYALDKGAILTGAIPIPPVFNEVLLSVSALLPGIVYTLEVSGVKDCAGNSIGILNTCKAGMPSGAGAMDMVINEILFNPPPTGTDYVEFFNRSDKILDASLLLVCSRGITGNLSPPRKLSESPYLIFPSDFVVATADASLVKALYTVRHPANMLTIPQLPSLPDDRGNITLLDHRGTIIDELSYDDEWHFPLILNTEGISLERIDHNQPTQQKDNWMSAAVDAGFGTPTYRNSQFRSAPALQGVLEITPPVFSPDGDGRDDLCFIHYQLPSPNYVASVTVFDVNGRAVRNLYRNITLSATGTFRWDGLDDNGRGLATGVYIVLTEIFNLEGKKNNFKNAVTLSTSF